MAAGGNQAAWSLAGMSIAAPCWSPHTSVPAPNLLQHPEGPDYKPDGVIPLLTTLRDFLLHFLVPLWGFLALSPLEAGHGGHCPARTNWPWHLLPCLVGTLLHRRLESHPLWLLQ